jgi:hypothetical protein
MPEKFCGYCNIVGFLDVTEEDDGKGGEKISRKLHVRENSRFYAKDLFDMALPGGFIPEPDISKLMLAVDSAKRRRQRPIKAAKNRRRPGPKRGKANVRA